MAVSEWVSIVGGTDTGLDVEAKLNSAFGNIDTEMAKIALIEEDISGLQTAISVVSATPLAEQVLVPDVAEKLVYMSDLLVDAGGSDLTVTIPTNNILVNTAGVYRVYGVISAYIPNNHVVDIELYIDNLPTGFSSSCVGKGTASRVTFTYAFMTPFIVNDDINLYVKSTGTSIEIQSASVTVEKTPY